MQEGEYREQGNREQGTGEYPALRTQDSVLSTQETATGIGFENGMLRQ